MKATELIRNAEAKKADYEVSENQLNYMIGIRFKNQHVYHWFNIWDNGDVSFNHSYSMNTGETYRGLRHSMKIKESLGFYKGI